MPFASVSLAGVRRGVRESVGGLPTAFWWLWTSTLVNRLGSFVATFLALYLTVERGYSASYAGLVVSLYGLGGVVASIGGGVLTDRVGRRPTMLIAQCSTAGTVAVLAFMESPVAIAAVAFCVGMASNASRPAVQAMMADIVATEDRVRAYALNYWAINLGFAVSSASAGFVAQYSYRAGFLAEAVLTLLCAVVVYMKLPESRPEQQGRSEGRPGGPAGRQGAGDGVTVGTVLRDARFMILVVLAFLLALVLQQGMVGLPIAMGEAGFTSSDFGLMISFNAVLIVLLQIPATQLMQRRDPRRLLIASSLLAGYGFGLTAFAGALGTYVATVFVWTLAEIINAATQTGLVVRLSPTHGRGRYQGMYWLAYAAATLTAPLVSGTVIDHFGARWLWGACAVLGTVTGIGYWLLMRGLPPQGGAGDELPAAAGTESAAA
jgi:MFS family permease